MILKPSLQTFILDWKKWVSGDSWAVIKNLGETNNDELFPISNIDDNLNTIWHSVHANKGISRKNKLKLEYMYKIRCNKIRLGD